MLTFNFYVIVKRSLTHKLPAIKKKKVKGTFIVYLRF